MLTMASVLGSTVTRFRLRVCIAGALTVLLAVLLGLQWVEKEDRSRRRIGVSLEEAEQGLLVSGVSPGLPADAAGLMEGDQVLRIGGAVIRDRAGFNIAAARFDRDTSVPFEIRRGGATMTLAVRPGVPFPAAEFLGNILIVLGYFALGLIVYFQPVHALSKRLLYLFSFGIALEFALPAGTWGGTGLVLMANIGFYLLSGAQFSVEVHLASCIPDRHPLTVRLPSLVPLFYALGLGFGLFSALTATATVLDWQWLPAGRDQAIWVLDYLLLPLWVVLLVAILGSRAVSHPQPLGRHQAGLVLLGVLPWIALVIYTSVLGLAGLIQPAWVEVGWAVSLFPFPLAVFFGMFRYQLFDLQLIVRKGMLYSALTGGLLLVFYASLGAGSLLLSRSLFGGQPSVWLVGGAALLLGLLVQPLKQGLQGFIDRRFFPERTALRERLLGLVRELPVHGNLGRMGERLAQRLREDFRVGQVLVLTGRGKSEAFEVLAHAGDGPPPDLPLPIPREDEALQVLVRGRRTLPADRLTLCTGDLPGLIRRQGAALVLPLIADQALGGIVLIGSKSGGERFRSEEVEMLDLVARHAAIVFENARLYSSATFDSLTGVLRREASMEKLELEIRRAIRYSRPLAIAMADLDYFKAVNDAHGHLAGDQVLQKVASELQEGLRGTDFLGRYGGDEFLVVFPETPMDQAFDVAERVRKRLKEMIIPVPEGKRVRLTVSLGLAGLAGVDTDEASILGTLLHEADNKLYEAKQAGRNRCQVAGA